MSSPRSCLLVWGRQYIRNHVDTTLLKLVERGSLVMMAHTVKMEDLGLVLYGPMSTGRYALNIGDIGPYLIEPDKIDNVHSLIGLARRLLMGRPPHEARNTLNTLDATLEDILGEYGEGFANSEIKEILVESDFVTVVLDLEGADLRELYIEGKQIFYTSIEGARLNGTVLDDVTITPFITAAHQTYERFGVFNVEGLIMKRTFLHPRASKVMLGHTLRPTG